MNNVTKFKILRPAHEVFEAFVDPSKIRNFWFSSSSERWEPGKTVTLRYDEYDAQVNIKVMEVEVNKRIVFQWVPSGNVVTITLKEVDNASTIVEVNEEGFDENDEEFIHQLLANKEGWVYVLTCLKGYLEFGVNQMRAGLVKD
jgi:uncharacterized protein YndB with AHSA1/START domain